MPVLVTVIKLCGHIHYIVYNSYIVFQPNVFFTARIQ